MNEYVVVGLGIAIVLLVAISFLMALFFRRVVPTNMVHIVQSSGKTTPYGRGKEAGNSYYQWPSFLPLIGVDVTTFPESIFPVQLHSYESYDSARLPFIVDIAAFFRVDDASVAAQRVSTFSELQVQLTSVLQGAVRRILASNSLEHIMQERSIFGDQFTQEVAAQIKEWGVVPVKTIEFMDIRDSKDATVIKNIMAKEKSRIDMESRIQVAENGQLAMNKEIDAQRTVDINQQEARQQVGIRTAQADQAVGLEKERSSQAVAAEAKTTAERKMEIVKVQEVRSAEIQKDVAIVQAEQQRQLDVINADAEKSATVLKATGNLEAANLDAQGIRAVGIAEADKEKAMLMAPIETQITLAKEIGENQGYQQYLVTIRQIEAGQAVGYAMAEAMSKADLKVIANSGDMQQGVASLGDMFSPAGGTKLSGMLEALAQSPVGKAILEKVTDRPLD